MHLITTLIGLILLLHPQGPQKEIMLEDKLVIDRKTTLIIDNLYGNIVVKNSPEEAVSYRVKKIFAAPTNALLEKGIRDVQLKVLERNDSVILFVDAPFICSQWNGCDNNYHKQVNVPYDFRFDYVVELPASCNLNVNTIDNGNISITGIQGTVTAGNVNGDVTIEKAKSVVMATTINGDVSVYYQDVPNVPGAFHTINGTINIFCTKELNAVVTAKSMHGELFTDFDYEQRQPELIREVSNNGDETLYKLEETFSIEIGKNGPTLSCETLNGNIYLKRTKK